MNAIRRDEELDNVHSIYVDQWDWEKVITPENRNLDFLKLIVRAIVKAICATNDRLHVRYPQLPTELSREVTFITSQELEDRYPELPTGSQRENAYVREHKTACVMQIGGKLRSGKPHDGRAPDYDDWNLNGDIFFWDETAWPGSWRSPPWASGWMPSALDRQLTQAGCDERRKLPFHQMLLNGRAAPDHRRRHRPVPSVYADAGLRPHRRGSVQRLGRPDGAGLRAGGNPAAVKKPSVQAPAQGEKAAKQLAVKPRRKKSGILKNNP